MEAKKNLVWIELPAPASKEDGEEQCRLANNMLERLTSKEDVANNSFFYMENKSGRFTLCLGGPYGYVELPDRGQWFNLDYLGREAG